MDSKFEELKKQLESSDTQARRAAVASLDTLISQAAEQATELPQTAIDALVEAMKDTDTDVVSKALAVVLLVASLHTSMDVKENASTLIRRAEQTIKLDALAQKMVDSLQTSSVPKVKAFILKWVTTILSKKESVLPLFEKNAAIIIKALNDTTKVVQNAAEPLVEELLRLCGDRLNDTIQASGVSQERIASISAKLGSVSHEDSKPSNVKKIDVESDDTLNKELDAVTSQLKDEDWSKRADGLQRLIAIASGNASTTFSKTFMNRLCGELKTLVAAQITDLRSTLVKVACQCAVSLSTCGCDAANDAFVDAALRVSASGTKVLADMGGNCLTSVLSKAKVSSGLGKLLDALHSKNSFVRRKTVDGITNVVKNMALYNNASFEKFFSQLNFSELLTDGSNEVRIAARKLYWASDAAGIPVDTNFPPPVLRNLLSVAPKTSQLANSLKDKIAPREKVSIASMKKAMKRKANAHGDDIVLCDKETSKKLDSEQPPESLLKKRKTSFSPADLEREQQAPPPNPERMTVEVQFVAQQAQEPHGGFPEPSPAALMDTEQPTPNKTSVSDTQHSVQLSLDNDPNTVMIGTAVMPEHFDAGEVPSRSASQSAVTERDEDKPGQADVLSQMGLYQIPEDIDEEAVAMAGDPLATVDGMDGVLGGFDESETKELEELDKELQKLEGTETDMDAEPAHAFPVPSTEERRTPSPSLSATHGEMRAEDEINDSPQGSPRLPSAEQYQNGANEASQDTENGAEEWDAELERLGAMKEHSEVIDGAQKILEMAEKDSDRYNSVALLIELVCKRFKADLLPADFCFEFVPRALIWSVTSGASAAAVQRQLRPFLALLENDAGEQDDSEEEAGAEDGAEANGEYTDISFMVEDILERIVSNVPQPQAVELIDGALHEHDVCAAAKESLLYILSVLLSVPAFDFDKLPAVLSSTLIQGLRSTAAGVRKEAVVCAGILRRNGKLSGFATLDKAEQSLVSLYCSR